MINSFTDIVQEGSEEEILLQEIDENKIPVHLAVIMDGNGRWAKRRGNERVFGHKNGVKAVRETVEAAAELGVNYMTLYAFSTENWSRPTEEVKNIFKLLKKFLKKEPIPMKFLKLSNEKLTTF